MNFVSHCKTVVCTTAINFWLVIQNIEDISLQFRHGKICKCWPWGLPILEPSYVPPAGLVKGHCAEHIFNTASWLHGNLYLRQKCLEKMPIRKCIRNITCYSFLILAFRSLLTYICLCFISVKTNIRKSCLFKHVQ